jgi:creatinine amidohydrolase
MTPVIRPGCSDHHMAFSGTISLRPETLKAILYDCCASLTKHGFKKIIIVTVHGGNLPPMVEVAPELAQAFPKVELHVMTQAEPMLKSVRQVSDRRGVDHLAAGAHAGEAETSLILAGAPELVEMDRAEPGLKAEASEWMEKAHTEGLQAVTPNGVLGDPDGANADAGHDYLEALAAHHVCEYLEGRMRIVS